MIFTDFIFVLINLKYIQQLFSVDSEVFFNNDPLYASKPYLGILINNNGKEYAIPLTSAKPKHANWRDVTEDNYRIFEIIDSRKVVINPDDVVIPMNDTHTLSKMNINPSDYIFYKKRILSILEIKKMIPIKKGYYTIVNFNITPSSKEEEDRINLMKKEYAFCKRIKSQIERKANKIYIEQMNTGKVKPFYCNFKKLEQKSDLI